MYMAVKQEHTVGLQLWLLIAVTYHYVTESILTISYRIGLSSIICNNLRPCFLQNKLILFKTK
jgi:hypothetical protein